MALGAEGSGRERLLGLGELLLGSFLLLLGASAVSSLEGLAGSLHLLLSLGQLLERLLEEDNRDEFRAFAGYAGWGAGQLDMELDRGDWHLVSGSGERVFTERPGTLNNDFFVNLLDMSTKWSKSSKAEGVYEGRDRVSGELKWTATPVDLTGATAKMEVRSDTAIGVVLELSTANGRITIDGPNGVLTLRVAAADTAALSLVDFPARYDLLLTYADTTVDRILEGLVRLNPAVTEP